MTEEPLAIAPAPTGGDGRSYLEWGAVFGGAAIAVAMSVILLQFGAAVGLAVTDSVRSDGGASWNVLIAGLWTTLVALAAASAGGYIAGRMRSRFGDAVADEVEFRDGAHGLVVWAVATLGIGVVMAAVAAVPSMAANVSDVEPTANMLRWTANVSTIFAFASAAGAALSAAAAYMAVTVGGGHRDKGVSIHLVTPRMFRRKAS